MSSRDTPGPAGVRRRTVAAATTQATSTHAAAADVDEPREHPAQQAHKYRPQDLRMVPESPAAGDRIWLLGAASLLVYLCNWSALVSAFFNLSVQITLLMVAVAAALADILQVGGGKPLGSFVTSSKYKILWNIANLVSCLATLFLWNKYLYSLLSGFYEIIALGVAVAGGISQVVFIVKFQVAVGADVLDAAQGGGVTADAGIQQQTMVPRSRAEVVTSGKHDWRNRAFFAVLLFTAVSLQIRVVGVPLSIAPLMSFFMMVFFVNVPAARIGNLVDWHPLLAGGVVASCIGANFLVWGGEAFPTLLVAFVENLSAFFFGQTENGTLFVAVLFVAMVLVFLKAVTDMPWWQVALIGVVPFVAASVGRSLLFGGVCTNTLGTEDPAMRMNPAKEQELVQFVENAIWLRSKEGGQTPSALRILHAKAHACARARILIRPELPPRLRVGLFAMPGAAFDAYIRFSNGDGGVAPDSHADVRGMAIKVVGANETAAHYPRLMEGDSEEFTQDFVLVSTSRFFTGDAQRYLALVRTTSGLMSDLMAFVFPSWNPSTWTISPLLNAIQMARESASMANPLAWTYYSTTPYRLGDDPHVAVKYIVSPCIGYSNSKSSPVDDAARDVAAKAGTAATNKSYLRNAMARSLTEGDACFELRVQYQEDACKHPIEDPTVPWADARVDTVATIILPKQRVLQTDMLSFCEALSYNPWHGFEPHRPLGAVNHVRKLAYLAGSSQRRALNGVLPSEPTGQIAFIGAELADQSEGAGNPVGWRHARYASPNEGLPTHLETFPVASMKVLENLHAILFPPPLDVPQPFDLNKILRILVFVVDAVRTQIDHAMFGKPYSQWTTAQDYEHMYGPSYMWTWWFHLPLPEIARNGEWAKDETFGWQYIRGINPVKIVNASAVPLPAWIKVGALGHEGQQLLVEQRLFYAEYTELEDIYAEPGRVFYAPAVVLRFDPGPRALVPILIQLSRSGPALRPPPETPDKAWLFAKMIVANADAIHHEMGSHLCLTHLWTEPIAVSFYRQLGLNHAVMKLMVPHFRQTIAINDLGRKTLLAATNSVIGSIVSTGITGALQFMAQTYTRTNFTARAFPNELKARGFRECPSPDGPADMLPGYFYRDDGCLIWKAMSNYVREAMVEAGYEDPRVIKSDKQLQALLRELGDPQIANVKGVPTISTVDDLTFFLTTILFTVSAQHSAVNFGQFDFYGFVPNRPLLLNRGMPEDLTTVNDAFIMSALPSLEKAWDTAKVLRIISLPAERTIDIVTRKRLVRPLGDIADEDRAFAGPYNNFVSTLEAIEKVIIERNTRLNISYPYLLPTKIASSIAI